MNDLKIKFYTVLKENGVWANEFTENLTFGELIEAIKKGEHKKDTVNYYCAELDKYIDSDVFLINEMIVKGVLLEDGTRILFRPNIGKCFHENDSSYVVLNGSDPKEIEILNQVCYNIKKRFP